MKKIKCAHLHIKESQKKKKEKEWLKNVLDEIMSGIFPNLKKETHIQVQEAQGVPNQMNPKRSTQRHIIIKMANVKDNKKPLKATREKSHL